MDDTDNLGKIRLSGVVEESVVDGDGIRFTVFTQGCTHNCKGCHNPHTHDINGGKLYSISELLEKVKKNPLLDGVTFSGGEPFMQAKECAVFSKELKKSGLNIWCYSGYTLEQLEEKAKTDEHVKDFLRLIDVLVDGPYIDGQKDLLLPFRGSKNQRIIRLKDI